MTLEHEGSQLILPLGDRLIAVEDELFLPAELTPEELLIMSQILKDNHAAGEMEHIRFQKKVEEIAAKSHSQTISLKTLYRDPHSSQYVVLHDPKNRAYIYIQEKTDGHTIDILQRSRNTDFAGYRLEVRTIYPGIVSEAEAVKDALLEQGYPVFHNSVTSIKLL